MRQGAKKTAARVRCRLRPQDQQALLRLRLGRRNETSSGVVALVAKLGWPVLAAAHTLDTEGLLVALAVHNQRHEIIAGGGHRARRAAERGEGTATATAAERRCVHADQRPDPPTRTE